MFIFFNVQFKEPETLLTYNVLLLLQAGKEMH